MTNTLDTTERAWPKETRAARLDRCRVYLFHHGLITQAESDRLAAKIHEAAQEGKRGRKGAR